METAFTPRGKIIAFWALLILTLGLLAHFFALLSPFMWAIVTAYICAPIVNSLTRLTRLPRPLVAGILYSAIAAGIVYGVLILVPIVREQAVALSRQLPQSSSALIEYIDQRFPDLSDRLGLDPAALKRQISEAVNQISARAPSTAVTITQRIFHLLIEMFVYLIATFFFFVQGDRFIAVAHRALPLRYQREARRVASDINSTLGGYLRGQVILVIIMSSTTYIALRIYDVDYAFAIALTTGFLELVPIIGPWTAGAIAVSVAAFDATPPFGWSHTTLAIAVAITYFVLRQLEDNLIIPTLIGRIVHLHPLLMIFVLLIGTSLGGALGLLLAVPFAAVVRILLGYIYGKIVAEGERSIVTVDARDDLVQMQDELPERTNIPIVLMVRSGVLDWQDLPLVQEIGARATRYSVPLSVVTPDTIAGTLFSAVGVETTVIQAARAEPVAQQLAEV
jgi:predicted PurR-regulated permease PerM